ncbi:MAG: hypothetical protein SFV19_14090 [Rhodospirillaceae bacterium]|nr:hypothetical protein [Rhodospirillaceae bacterium]
MSIHGYSWAVLLGLVLSGCGPVPQPFQGTAKVTADIALLDVPSAVGIAILPIEGLTDPFAGEMAAAVARALEASDIPAQAMATNTGLGFNLRGKVVERSDKAGTTTMRLSWTLASRKGVETGVYDQQATMLTLDLENANAGLAERLGRDAAAVITAMIEGGDALTSGPVQPQAPAKAQKPDFPRVSIKPTEGAPGDGRTSLQLATLQGLVANGVKRDDVTPEVILASVVTLKPAPNGQEFVEIAWRALTPTGEEIGEAKLTNTIPRGMLNTNWGPTAFAIAEAGLPQLLELLALAPRR